MTRPAPIIRSCGIVGGGIGGLTLANALHQQGIHVRVFEKASHFIPTAGAGFGFAPNGQHCLASLGLGPELTKKGHPLRKHVILDRDSKNEVASSNSMERLEKKYGYSLLGMLRADLVNVLEKPLKENDLIQYSANVTDVVQDDASATVHLESGESFQADLVVGADGVNSTVLKSVFPEQKEDQPIHSGENIFYGVIEDGVEFPDGPKPQFPFQDPNLGKAHTILQSFGTCGEFISFPTGTNTLVWAQTYKGNPPKYGEWGSGPEVMDQLDQFLKIKNVGVDHPIMSLKKATRPDRLLHFGLIYRQTKTSWHEGRVCLLGDSCHATLPYVGQGANQAIEDAIVLSQELSKSEASKSLEQALNSYFERRYARARKFVLTAKYLGKFMHSESEIRAKFTEVVLGHAIRSGVFVRTLADEITQHCPIPVPDLDPSIKP